jgi:formylglycine-generating enzyme
MSRHIDLSPPVFPFRWASDWGEDRYGLWQAFIYKGVRLSFRWLPPGEFDMGSPETEQGRWDDEDLHHVTLNNGFWMAETTVTQALWQAVMGENPSFYKGDNRPVEFVSWDDVQSFIQRVNQFQPSLITRLPWEAEWEYACRAGTQTPFNFSGDLTLAKVNYRGLWDGNTKVWGKGAKRETADVKSYPCNDWGLYEMHGNVWEWCEDTWIQHLGSEEVIDPWQASGSAADTDLVVRGGSWVNDGRRGRSALRRRFVPGVRRNNLGFRLALGHSG